MGLFDRKPGGDTAKLEDAKKRLASDPANVPLSAALADALLGAGNRAAAIEVLTKTGSALQRAGRAPEAAAVLSRVQQIDPKGELPASFLALHMLREARQAAGKPISSGAIPAAAAPPPPADTAPIAPPSVSPERVAVRAAAAKHPILHGIPAGILAALQDELTLETRETGEELFREGDGGSFLFLVASGELALFGRDEAGRESPVGTIPAGEIAGEMGFMYGSPRTVTARATRRTETLALSRVAAEPILQRYRKLGEAIREVGRRRSLDLMLARSRAFRTLPPEERSYVLQRMLPMTARPGDVLTREGSQDTDFCLLKSGQAEVTATSRGCRVLLSILDPNDCFGEAAALSSVPRTATVTAITEVEYYALRKADMVEIARRYPAVKSELQALSMERFVEAARLLAE